MYIEGCYHKQWKWMKMALSFGTSMNFERLGMMLRVKERCTVISGCQ